MNDAPHVASRVPDAPHVLVAGAGIGGLCLAQGLRRAGVGVTVFEADPAPGDLGAAVARYEREMFDYAFEAVTASRDHPFAPRRR